MKILMIFLMSTLAFASGNVKNDEPIITNDYGTTLVQYPVAAGGRLEAWELVENEWGNGVYFNYSRFYWGYNDPTWPIVNIVCYGKVAGVNYVGVTDQPARLLKAMRAVASSRFGEQVVDSFKCEAYQSIIATDSTFSDLMIFFDSF